MPPEDLRGRGPRTEREFNSGLRQWTLLMNLNFKFASKFHRKIPPADSTSISDSTSGIRGLKSAADFNPLAEFFDEFRWRKKFRGGILL